MLSTKARMTISILLLIFFFDIAVEKNRMKEVSKGFLIELEVSSFVV